MVNTRMQLTENVLLAVLIETDLPIAASLELDDELFKRLLQSFLALLFSVRVDHVRHLGAWFLRLLHLHVLRRLLLLHCYLKFD